VADGGVAMISGVPLLRVGDEGPLAGEVHQALLEAGYQVDAGELAAGKYGPSSYDAVRAFQASHLGPDRHPLTEDGIVGPATLFALRHPSLEPGQAYTVPGWRYDLSAVREQVRRVVEVAVRELGVHEQPDGSNRGPRVDQYTAPTLGVPWCAGFVSWCFARGEGGSPFGRILSTWGLYDWAKARGCVLGEAALPQPGDVFVILRGDRHGHTGLVVHVLDDGRLATCEGNASNAVRGCIRPRSGVSAILRPVPLV
jgi:hypothetical protein